MSNHDPTDHLARYRPYLDGFDLTDAEKTELLQALWTIMGSFVERAFNDDPVQHALGATGKASELATGTTHSAESEK